MEAHTCGFPTDPERVRSVEESFGLQGRRPGGCLVFSAAVVVMCIGGVCLAFV
jgi:hypothetical protein